MSPSLSMIKNITLQTIRQNNLQKNEQELLQINNHAATGCVTIATRRHLDFDNTAAFACVIYPSVLIVHCIAVRATVIDMFHVLERNRRHTAAITLFGRFRLLLAGGSSTTRRHLDGFSGLNARRFDTARRLPDRLGT
jgi:hypothetical protein